MKINLLPILLIAMLTLTACNNNNIETPSEDAVKIEFYVMSQCPFGTQVENAVKPVLEKFGEDVNFRLEFIGAGTDGKYQSLHGQPEVDGNKVQLCAQKYEPKYMEMIVCMNEDESKIPDNWEECAEGLNKDKIKECYEGDEANQLLEESFAKAQEKGISGSPTMFFNEEKYNGNRNEKGFTRAICKNLEGHELCTEVYECDSDIDCPATGGQIPVCENSGTKEAKCSTKPDAKVEVMTLTHKDCTSCTVDDVITQLKQVIPNINNKYVDVTTEEGKELVAKYKIEKIPALIFEKTLEDTFLNKQQPQVIEQSFDKFDEGYLLKQEILTANFIINEEKRKEFYESLGITLGDNKPQIDFFVMSYCPYGNIAEEAISPVYDLLKDKAEFNPHYVIYSNYGDETYCYDDDKKYCSMHGVQELNQGIRELCVAKEFGMDEYFKFVTLMNEKCTYKNVDSCWEEKAKEANFDVDKIKTCFESEAETILKDELTLNKKYGAQGSPQIFIDGVEYAGGRAPESYKNALCSSFENKPAECNTVLSEESEGSTGSC